MLRSLLAAFGLSVAASAAAQSSGFAPYHDAALDAIYNLLFCDDPNSFRASLSGEPSGVWKVLFSTPPDTIQLRRITNDQSEESRVRALAFRLLTNAGESVQRKELLGVVVEKPMSGGLDVLAVYRDYSVRYLNHSGKLLIWETRDAAIDRLINEVFEPAEKAILSIGPWEKPRLAPPVGQVTRITFLVSDSLYFGQGPTAVLERDSIGGPVVAAATKLLLALVQRSTK